LPASPLRAALPAFDLTQAAERQGWSATHDLAPLESAPGGLQARILGGDPYLTGPSRDYPGGTLLWMHLRLKSDEGGMGQVFYFRNAATEADSVRFDVPAGQWHEAKLRLPALGSGYRLRIDPPGTAGVCVLASIRFEERVSLLPPAWPKPAAPVLAPGSLTVQSGPLKIVHNQTDWGGFEVHVDGQRAAVGHARSLIGYTVGSQARWLSLAPGGGNTITVQTSGAGLTVGAVCPDPDGGRWTLEQVFVPGSLPGAIDVETRVAVDRDRSAAYLPLLTLLPGLGTYGTNKTQALFAGIEYLENEPSSSEADVIGAGARRQVPDALKITFPLMAIAAEGRYVGLSWNPVPHVCAVFDSPDRLFGSVGHVMGLLAPGSDGLSREESSLLPYGGVLLKANEPLVVRATIMGGTGSSIVPAVQHYVRLRGLPPLPAAGLSAADYFNLAARGWLDSRIREGDLFRHAATAGFGATPAADAALLMDWLAGKVTEAGLAGRVAAEAQRALALVAPANYNSAQIGHVRYPVAALAYNAAPENAAQALAQGRGLLGRFESDGSVLYRPPADGLDYGRTHWARDASGLTAQVVAMLLEAAAFSGDPGLKNDGLRYLRALGKFRNGVPRGAQTWEIPLHTPDILASAYLVRAYTLGFELAGDPDFREQAVYWAWTGLPFVYLTPPTPQPVGLYSTIPVLGATAWTAPLWIGLPVQWCGLVYGDAVARLAAHDPSGPWRQVAEGIAIAGIQHTYPASDTNYVGLLPDSFNLRPQSRNGPAINPATVLAPAARFLSRPLLYDFVSFPRHGLLVHAPGSLTVLEERADAVKFTVQPWPRGACSLLINGLWKRPRLRLNDQETPLFPPHRYQSAEGRLVLQITTNSTIELFTPAEAALRIQRAPAPNAVALSWPSVASAYSVQQRAGWEPDWDWVDTDVQIESTAQGSTATHPIAYAQRFYRLRKRF
jgi:hypothetical protein